MILRLCFLFSSLLGSNYGAKISELVDLIMLSKLVNLFQNNSVGLYQNAGLVVLRNFSGLQTEILRKMLLRYLKTVRLASQVKQT